MHARQALVGAGTVGIGVIYAVGAVQIPGEAGYGGVGPNFLPWLVSVALLVCGAFLIWEAASGGFRQMEEPSGESRGHWPGFAWVSVGLLANAATITAIGFILSCTLCYVLAVRGFRSAEGAAGFDAMAVARDVLVGAAISAPVYWMFTKLLAINLPGLTASGWI